MKVGISGSSGLIGGRICQRLAGKIELVRLGRRSDCDIRVDFSQPDSVAAIDLTGCQAVVHCAGVVDEDFKTDPAAAYVQNTVGLASLARRAVACGVESLIYFSSSHVYGPLVGSVTEDTAINPLSDYAIAHYAAEQTLRRCSLNEGLKVLVLRPNAVFGLPAQVDSFDRWSLIPFSFPLQAVYKQKIILLTSGEQRRNFVGADDLGRIV
ncbi:MAG: NAD-dependent epimerase/dehydratase family protein, partial [Acidobacteriota bacterium]